MRKRSLLVPGCFVAVLLIGCLTLWLTWPVDRINREAFVRIRPGMTEGEVEEILGRPTGDGPSDAIVMYEGVPESFVDPASYPPDKRRQWVGSKHAVLIELDERGQVSGRYFGHVNQPEGWFTKLLRRFGL
jgi:hypothetical protein